MKKSYKRGPKPVFVKDDINDALKWGVGISEVVLLGPNFSELLSYIGSKKGRPPMSNPLYYPLVKECEQTVAELGIDFGIRDGAQRGYSREYRQNADNPGAFIVNVINKLGANAVVNALQSMYTKEELLDMINSQRD